jgi:hypothetical protein
MRTREDIEQRLNDAVELHRQWYGVDSDAAMRLYAQCRALYWVLHPEIKSELELIEKVNRAIGLGTDRQPWTK